MQQVVEVLSDPPALIQRALELVIAHVQQAIAQQGRCTIALSGGSTPKPLYEAIATQELPWENMHIFWGDERYVPPDHPDSNQKMARLTWLDQVSIPATNIHPMPTDEVDPIIAARRYEEHLREFFQHQDSPIPSFDLILLGMGEDGHTASLFPHTEALQIRLNTMASENTVLITVGSKDGQPRLTFTAPLINQAQCVMFIVAGANKQQALAQIFAIEGDDLTYPARLIRPQGELWWLLDQAAGKNLTSGLKNF